MDEDNIRLRELSAPMRALIQKRPLKTKLRSFSKKIEEEYNALPTQQFFRKDYRLPEEFEGQKIWRQYLPEIFNQGECGSCWSIATTTCLAARFNLQSYGNYFIDLSPALMLFCFLELDEYSDHLKTRYLRHDLSDYGCVGNSLIAAWTYLYIRGTCEHACVPNQYKQIYDLYDGLYTEIKNKVSCRSVTGPNFDSCVDSQKPLTLFSCSDFYYVAGTSKYGGSEKLIRHNIFEWGPVSSAMEVYEDFYQFDAETEIYQWNGQGKLISGHAIVIVGWGEEVEGTEGGRKKLFWWVRNSWGRDWGVEGYFRMVRGTNNCKIEENVIAPIPDFATKEGGVTNEYHFKMAASEKMQQLREANRDPKYPFTIDQKTGVLFSRNPGTRPPLFDSRLVPVTTDQWASYYAGFPGFANPRHTRSRKVTLGVVSGVLLVLFAILAFAELKHSN